MSDVQWKTSTTGERGSCAVRAVANACDVTWDEAHRALELSGREHGRGTPWHVTSRALSKLGYEMKAVTSPGERYKVATVADHCRASGRYICWVRGHVFAIINRQLQLFEAKRGGRPVIALYEVTKRKYVRKVGAARLPEPKVPKVREPKLPKPELTDREKLQALELRNAELVKRWGSKLRRAQNALKKLHRKGDRIRRRLREEDATH